MLNSPLSAVGRLLSLYCVAESSRFTSEVMYTGTSDWTDVFFFLLVKFLVWFGFSGSAQKQFHFL